MGKIILMLTILLTLISLILAVKAETTFFDDQDDAFIMGGFPTIDQVVTERTTGGGCGYKLNCTKWSKCLPSGKQTKNCTNIGTCFDTYKSLEIEQNCTYTVPESKKEEQDIVKKELVGRNKTIIYFIILLIIAPIISYLKRDYFKKLIKKQNKED